MFCGGSSDTTGAAGRDRLARPREHVGDHPADRRGHMALVEPPLHHRERGARGFDRGAAAP